MGGPLRSASHGMGAESSFKKREIWGKEEKLLPAGPPDFASGAGVCVVVGGG